MTRSFGSSRKTQPTMQVAAAPRPGRDPSITALGFTCYRLERIEDPNPGEPALEAIRLHETTSAMGVFAHSAEHRRERVKRRMRAVDFGIRNSLPRSA